MDFEGFKEQLQAARLEALAPIVQQFIECVESEGFTVGDVVESLEMILDNRKYPDISKLQELKTYDLARTN